MFCNQRSSFDKFLFRLLLLTMIVAPIAISCHPINTNTSNNLPATLVFGQGGGVTGKYTEFTLVSDGNLYRNDLQSGEKVFLKKIKKDKSRWFFIDAENLGLLTLNFNQPFNINYYITFIKGVKQNKVNWGDAKNPPPAGVKELWDKLWALTK